MVFGACSVYGYGLLSCAEVPEETELPPPSPATAAAAEEVQPEMHRPVQNNLTTAGESTLDRLRTWQLQLRQKLLQAFFCRFLNY
eukprot:791377-Amphidinium_carterae.1